MQQLDTQENYLISFDQNAVISASLEALRDSLQSLTDDKIRVYLETSREMFVTELKSLKNLFFIYH